VKAWAQDPTLIEVQFDVQEGTPVNAKSLAKLGSISLMSSPSISITTGAHDARRLQAGEAIAAEETVSIDDMTRKLSGIADNAADLITQVQGELKGISGQAQTLLTNLNDVTGTGNRRQVAEILRQVNSLVAEQRPKVDRITGQVELVSRDMDAVVKKWVRWWNTRTQR
jgi:ABC-type transporter Mla subunit MlaD